MASESSDTNFYESYKQAVISELNFVNEWDDAEEYMFNVELDIIKYLDNINVSVELQICFYDICIIICNNNSRSSLPIFVIPDKNRTGVFSDHVQYLSYINFTDIFNYLDSLKFNKTLGKFINYPVNDEIIKKYNKVDDCVICYENTINFTECNHAICPECINKLKFVGINQKCPICRRNI